MQLSRNVRFDKIDGDESFRIRSGTGNSRITFAVQSSQAQELIDWLLKIRGPKNREDVVSAAQQVIGISKAEAEEVCEAFVNYGVLEEEPDATMEKLRDEWSQYGWRDAADFHIACRELSFVPDNDEGSTYKEIYTDLLSEPDFAGGQRAHYSPKETGEKFSIESTDLDPTVEVCEVFGRSHPINKFVGEPPQLANVLGAIRDGFGVQRLVSGSLGTHQKRPYPSGGARHPFELYLIARLESEHQYSSYWYDPITHELHLQKSDITKRSIDNACFGKGGVVSSEIFIAITCRWARHSWKYRYSRSYRMVMLELGHLVQSLNLNFRARGIDVFQCPSMYDSKWSELLSLEDDCNEAPLYILSLGTEGIL